MARDGNGAFTRTDGTRSGSTVWAQAKAASVKIVAENMDTHDQDIATAITASLAKDGQTDPTANLPMATFRHTGVGNGSARTDYASMGQSQDGKINWVDGGGTADAITATYSPAITALVDGQLCFVRATAANATTTPTFSPNGLTARTIVKTGGNALAAGDIVGDGHELIFRYLLASTRWELLNPAPGAAVNVTVADESSDTTCFPLFATAATGNLPLKSGTNLTFNSNTGALGITTLELGHASDTTLARASAGDVDIEGNIIYRAGGTDIPTGDIENNAIDETKLKDALIGDFTEVVVALGDSFLFGDVTDSGNTKRDTIQGLLVLTGFQFVSTDAITAAALLSVTGLVAGYDYKFALENFAPNVDANTLFMRLSDDAGVSYEAGATDYSWGVTERGGLGEDLSDSEWEILGGGAGGMGNDAGNNSAVEITMLNPNASGDVKSTIWTGFFMSEDATPFVYAANGGGIFLLNTDPINAVQFGWGTNYGTDAFKAQGDISVYRRKRS